MTGVSTMALRAASSSRSVGTGADETLRMLCSKSSVGVTDVSLVSCSCGSTPSGRHANGTAGAAVEEEGETERRRE